MSIVREGLSWLRALSLRSKLTVTILAAVVAVLGGSTYLSFRFWQHESALASERQALLAASATRAAVETSLRAGQVEVARRNLRRLLSGGGVAEARLWSPEHTVILSLDRTEEGRSAENVWIPDAAQLDRGGVVRPLDPEGAVRAYIPVSVPGPAVLEVVVREAGARSAMQRGAYLGIGLTVISVLIVTVLVITMFEWKVVAPVQALAADQDRRLVAQDGLARVGGLAAEMAHEFKRPLASIQTAVDVLDQEHTMDEEGRVLLEAVHHQLGKLSETMRDLLSLARPVQRNDQQVRLADVLDDALLQVAGFAGAGQVSIHRDYDREVCVYGEPHCLSQAFLNVFSNAIEAMPDGGELGVRIEDSNHHVTVHVSDTGTGLTPEEVERVLVPFYSTKPQGTGLGLSLVTRIVDAHGGTLDITEREGGGGTTVRIRLPVDRSALRYEASDGAA